MHIFVAFLQALCLYHKGISYFCVDNLFHIICLHMAIQFRILQYRIINTPTLEDKDKLGQDSNSDSSDKFQEFISLIDKVIEFKIGRITNRNHGTSQSVILISSVLNWYAAFLMYQKITVLSL